MGEKSKFLIFINYNLYESLSTYLKRTNFFSRILRGDDVRDFVITNLPVYTFILIKSKQLE